MHLRDDQEVQFLSLADDGIKTAIEVFAPTAAARAGGREVSPGS